MRMSQLFVPTLKETPREAELVSHRYMLRAGLIRRMTSGIYSYLTLGYRVCRKIEQIVREEMNRQGGQELHFPALQPAELWQESCRWDDYGAEMFKLTDRQERSFCLGPTHEEVFTDLIRREVNSYRQLPLLLYQIQTKYRDEIRPRFGVMRGREFTMKDLYSFDLDESGLDESYMKMYRAYSEIFRRCGLDTVVVEADTGTMGGTDSHEFVARAESGEAEIVICPHCEYAANTELATSRQQEPESDTAPIRAGDGEQKPERVETPGASSIEDLRDFFGAGPERMIKTLIYRADGRPVMVLISGDDDLNETKLKNILQASTLEMADEALIREVTGAPPGFSGPLGVEGVEVIADHRVLGIRNGITGANEADRHYINVRPGRDFTPDRETDLRLVRGGDACSECGRTLEGFRGIEVGHIFKLGTKYSRSLGATYLDEDGEAREILMGSYGIGIDRTMAAIIEQNHDRQGIIWPPEVAPFQVLILSLGGDEEVRNESEALYGQLKERGVEVLFDDRNERAGVKFNDADLIGIPLRITIGSRSIREGRMEFRIRESGREFAVDLEHGVERTLSLLDSLRDGSEEPRGPDAVPTGGH